MRPCEGHDGALARGVSWIAARTEKAPHRSKIDHSAPRKLKRWQRNQRDLIHRQNIHVDHPLEAFWLELLAVMQHDSGRIDQPIDALKAFQLTMDCFPIRDVNLLETQTAWPGVHLFQS